MAPELPAAARLEELIALAAHSPVSRDEFEQAVLTTSLHALMRVREEEESDPLPETGGVELITWAGEDGAVIPIFTSEARVREATQGRIEGCEVIAVPGAVLFQVLAQTGLPVALNPNCDHGKRFTVAEIARLGEAGPRDPDGRVP
jgi:hypothetical protein